MGRERRLKSKRSAAGSDSSKLVKICRNMETTSALACGLVLGERIYIVRVFESVVRTSILLAGRTTVSRLSCQSEMDHSIFRLNSQSRGIGYHKPTAFFYSAEVNTGIEGGHFFFNGFRVALIQTPI